MEVAHCTSNTDFPDVFQRLCCNFRRVSPRTFERWADRQSSQSYPPDVQSGTKFSYGNNTHGTAGGGQSLKQKDVTQSWHHPPTLPPPPVRGVQNENKQTNEERAMLKCLCPRKRNVREEKGEMILSKQGGSRNTSKKTPGKKQTQREIVQKSENGNKMKKWSDVREAPPAR